MESAWINIGYTAVLAGIILIGSMIWLLFPNNNNGNGGLGSLTGKFLYTFLLIILALRLTMTLHILGKGAHKE